MMEDDTEKSLDSQLWHACAGGMVQMPAANSKVFYFPQGHAEHAHAAVDFSGGGASPSPPRRLPPFILCRVAQVKFRADPDSDEVYARLRLVPLNHHRPSSSPTSKELHHDDGDDDGADLAATNVGGGGGGSDEKPASFAKTLTQSDANNGGGFSVPRYCAETIFPRLDYSADPPVQIVIAKDVHGEVWRFRHIYRGTPRRHLLTTGWSNFVNQKKLVAGDSIVFLRTATGNLCVGIRRAKRGIGGRSDSQQSGWNSGAVISPYGGFSALLLREDDGSKVMRSSRGGGGFRGRVRPESVVEAAVNAANGQPFDVVYYPRASTPEFCVKASAVRAAMRTQWCSGMRFKMAFETEDSSRISWFMGTISSVHVADPIRWPNSPWRLLQVTWDEPDLLQNVKRVSPWLVELVSNMPIVHLSPFSPARKKLRILQHPDFPLDGQIPMPSFAGNPLRPSSPMCSRSDNTPAGIQGARHAQFGIPFPDLELYNKLRVGMFPPSFQHPHSRISNDVITRQNNCNENISCLLTIGNSSQKLEKCDNGKKPQFLLFGQPILTEQQISRSCSTDAVSEVLTEKSLSNETLGKTKNFSQGFGAALVQNSPLDNLASPVSHHPLLTTELGLDTGHCKVFLESEDVGRTLELSVLGSYEELHRRLANMFGIERSEMLSRVLYRDATGTVKRTGDEPFSVFVKNAKRLTILMDSGCDNIRRPWMTGVRNAGNGLDSSNKTGPLSIFA